MRRLALFVIVYPAFAAAALRAGASLAGFASAAEFLSEASPVSVVITLAAGWSVASFLLGAVTGDYSWVDRLWSTAPVVFGWIYAVRSGFAPAVTAGAVLVTLWGARLTFNFARRGGYTTMEDYRWAVLRQRIGSAAGWQAFNLLFICGFQVALFVLFTLPLQRLAAVGFGPVPGTFLCALAFLAALVYETVADQQQWTFQGIKHGIRDRIPPAWYGRDRESAEAALEADIRRGFVTHGLFRLSRHPNYFGELACWWALFCFAAVATGTFLDLSGLGVVLLTALFIGSTSFTESISLSRYPEYDGYRRTTSPIVPWPPKAAREYGSHPRSV